MDQDETQINMIEVLKQLSLESGDQEGRYFEVVSELHLFAECTQRSIIIIMVIYHHFKVLIARIKNVVTQASPKIS